MLVLFETPAGYALFKVSDEKKLKKVDNLFSEFETADKANSFVKLQAFYRFADTTEVHLTGCGVDCCRCVAESGAADSCRHPQRCVPTHPFRRADLLFIAGRRCCHCTH